MCSSDYVVFHNSDTGSTTDPAYHHHHEDYNQGDGKQNQYDLSGFKRISPTPKFTLSHSYISPENAEPHFTRSVSPSKNGYSDGYSAFLQNNFEGNDDDDGNDNSKYQQKNYDDDEDEEVNSEYRQKNYDFGDKDEEVNSKYRHAPKDAEDNGYHYDNGHEFDRIQSLSQKEEAEPKQSSKNCKIIVKGKAMCRLCKDPVSGAHSESCSFSSSPPEKKYAYIKKEKYIS